MNLNLLVALDALLREQNVSRAAQKLFLTQSAVSIMLKQLREIFSDDLLVRDAKAMMITPFALQLAPKVKHILMQIKELASITEEFDPLNSKREFKLYISEYTEFAVLPQLYEYVMQHAPNVKFNIKRASQYYDAAIFSKEIEELYLGPIDIKLPARFQKQILFSESLVIAGRKTHPALANKLTLSDYKCAKFIIGERIGHGEVLNELKIKAKKLGLPAKNITLVPHVATAIYLADKINVLTILPKKLATIFIRGTNLIYNDLPFPPCKADVYQIWPQHLNNDPGLTWLRNIIAMAAK